LAHEAKAERAAAWVAAHLKPMTIEICDHKVLKRIRAIAARQRTTPKMWVCQGLRVSSRETLAALRRG
jgi:hypothetical protein